MAEHLESTAITPHAGLLKIPSCALALSFGAGLSPWAPGSVGALVAFPIFAVIVNLPLAVNALVIVALFVLGCVACSNAEQVLGKSDHGAIVWDETIGLLLVLLVAPASPWWWAASYVAFRFFDILKPWPIRLADVYAKGGVAVMADDVLAAVYAAASIWLANYIITSVLTG